MPGTACLLAAVAVSAGVTWGLRGLPFAAVARSAPADLWPASAPACLPGSW